MDVFGITYPYIDKCPYIMHVLKVRLYLLNKKLKLLKRKCLHNIGFSQNHAREDTTERD